MIGNDNSIKSEIDITQSLTFIFRSLTHPHVDVEKSVMSKKLGSRFLTGMERGWDSAFAPDHKRVMELGRKCVKPINCDILRIICKSPDTASDFSRQMTK